MKKVVRFISVFSLLFCLNINSIVYAEEHKNEILKNEKVEETKPEEDKKTEPDKNKLEENKEEDKNKEEENKLEENKEEDKNKLEENKLEEDKNPNEKKPIIKLSDNNNIKEIKLSAGTINFDKYNLLYFINVDDNVEEIDVEAILEDRTARIKGNGNYKLNYGENTINLEVTAQDRTTKTYILVINRKEKEMEQEPEKQLENEIDQVTNEQKLEKKNIKLIIILLLTILIIALSVTVYLIKKWGKK